MSHQTISAEQVYERLTASDSAQHPTIVDVREPDEWAEGHIEGATHIPLGTLPTRLQDLPKDQDIILVCHMGGRSERATVFLEKAGYTNAINMTGGMDAWEGHHLPIVK